VTVATEKKADPWGAAFGKRIPFWLTTLRLLLAPAVIVLALIHRRGLWMIFALTAALITDIFDGIIARKYNVATEGLRRYDSWTDTIFYMAVAISAWLLEAEKIAPILWLILLVAAIEMSCYAFDLVKFRKVAAYHMWSGKFWGLLLAPAVALLLAYGISGWFLKVALVVGIVSVGEHFAMSLVLPQWTHDVPSIIHALRIRRDLLLRVT
jgi:CDP-diacylglycerol---glycerol-3-phosphate 3-phosphatidyltransferase